MRARFDRIFRRRTGFATLDRLLARLHANKVELLTVLERPDIPLHTNGSERNIRGHVIKRKISGGTHSNDGRDCRDAFLGLMHTASKIRHRILVLPRRAPRHPVRYTCASPARPHPLPRTTRLSFTVRAFAPVAVWGRKRGFVGAVRGPGPALLPPGSPRSQGRRRLGDAATPRLRVPVHRRSRRMP